MGYYHEFHDAPPVLVDEQGPLNVSCASKPYNAATSLEDCWQPMNAANDGTRTVQGLDTHLRNVEFYLSTFDRPDSGLEYSLDKQKVSRPQFDQPWEPSEPYPFLDRAQRYVSPGGHWGGDVSASEMESSPSENAWSPPSSQHMNAYPKNYYDWNMYGPPRVETPCHGGIGHFPAGSGAYFGQHLESTQSNGAPVVAMREIQQYPDPEPDTEEDARAHSIKIEFVPDQDHQAKYHSVMDDASFRKLHDEALGDSVMDDDSCKDDGEESEDNFSDYSPRKRPQRRSSHSRYTAPGSPNARRTRPTRRATSDINYRVSKASKQPSTHVRSQPKTRKSRPSNPPRPFVCSFAQYGCPSTFGSKNEWKRHVSSQHLQLGYYRCDVGQCNPDNAKTKNGTPVHVRGYNDFNRKDLFTQHQRRMHAPWPQSKTPSQQSKEDFEHSLEAVRERCWHENRLAPQQSVCGFCGRVFDGPSSWEERMEHVGKHYEKGDGEEKEDDELREWAAKEGLIHRVGKGRWRLKGLKEDRFDRVKAEPGVSVDDDEDAEGDVE